MIENKSNFTVKQSSEKSFAIVFSIFFLFLSLFPLIKKGNLILPFLICSIIFLVLAFTFPKILKYPNLLWLKFGNLLGLIFSPIIMLIIYIIVFFPIGIYFRVIGKDSLKLKIDKNAQSYWINSKSSTGDMKNQF